MPLPSPTLVRVTVSGLVTPWSVSSPVTSNAPAPEALMLLDLKEISGNSLAEKKSWLLRCWSRLALAVSTESVFTRISTLPASGAAASRATCPLTSLKRPHELDAPMWRIRKFTCECTASMVCLAGSAWAVTLAATPAAAFAVAPTCSGPLRRANAPAASTIPNAPVITNPCCLFIACSPVPTP